MKQQQVKIMWNHTENGQQMIFCEHWYYTRAGYKGDHEFLGEWRDVHNRKGWKLFAGVSDWLYDLVSTAFSCF